MRTALLTRSHSRRGYVRPVVAEMLPLESRLLLASGVSATPNWKLAVDPGPKQWAIRAGLVPRGGAPGATYPLSNVPALSSKADAPASLYLDFNGASAMAWGSYSVPATPAFDQDGAATSFSDGELASIQQIWARVAEAYSPFNINVTTADPGNTTDRITLRVVFGGGGSWTGGSYGGIAYVGSFYNTAPNTVWVFTKNLANGNAKYSADAAAHEAGHGFGLYHQSRYSGTTKTAEYNPGDAAVAPIMGVSYYSTRGLWFNGPFRAWNVMQDDLSVLAGDANGFGCRDDDHGDTTDAATELALDNENVSGSGIIGTSADQDAFSFSTEAGQVTLSVLPAQYGAMLDATLTLTDADGNVIAESATSALGETVTAMVEAGSYRLIVSGAGGYGDLGQYTVSGTIVPSPDYVAPPRNVSTAALAGVVTVSWTDAAWNETGYIIQRSSDGQTFTDVGTADPDATSFEDQTVEVGSSYIYRVYATGPVQDSGFSNRATVSVKPSSPANLAASVFSATQINLTWDDVTGETGYRIERSTNGTTWTLLGTAEADAPGYSSTALAAATRYYYRVAATSDAGDSPATAPVSATTLCAAPALALAVQSSSRIALTWTNVSGETGYRVERSDDGETWAQVATTAANIVTWAATTLSPGTPYCFRVKAVNASGTSDPGTASATTVLTAPTGLVATVPSTNRINLAWDNLSGETGYRLERLSGTTWLTVATTAADVVEYSHTGLIAGTTCTYRVKAVNAGGLSAAGASATATTIPSRVTGLAARATSPSQVSLGWTNLSGETGYRIEVSADGETWTTASTVSANTISATVSSLEADTAYSFRVTAYNASGDGESSQAVTTTTLLPTPTGLAAAVVSTSQINLTWDNSTNESGYRVERLSGATWVTIATPPADVTELAVAGLSAGTAYSFRVRAVGAGGSSLACVPVSATTLPAAPSLTASAASSTQINLSWTNVAGESGYKVERSADGDTWEQIAAPAANVAAFSNTGLTADTLYYYRVRAWNAAGDGAYSAPVSKTTLLPAPTGLAAEAQATSQISLTWNDSTGETGYRVERLSGATWVTLTTTAADTTTYLATGLSAGTSYSFRLRALNAGGASAASTTAIRMTLLAAPTLSSAVKTGTQVKLTWTNVAGESGYRVERSLDGETWGQVASMGANVLSWTNTGLSIGTAYHWRVVAFNGQGASSPSNVLSVTV